MSSYLRILFILCCIVTITGCGRSSRQGGGGGGAADSGQSNPADLGPGQDTGPGAGDLASLPDGAPRPDVAPADSGDPTDLLHDSGGTQDLAPSRDLAPREDAGRPATDGGEPTADSGQLDAGPGATDAGNPNQDTGLPTDGGGPPPAMDPTAVGPYAATADPATEVERGNRTIPIVVHRPAAQHGAVPPPASPLVIYLPGFQIPSRTYTPLAERLATHGFITILADPPASIFSTDHREMAADLSGVIDWALSPGGLAAQVDPTRIAAVGHSLGGKVSTMAAAADPRIRALFALDPVNAGGPFGYSNERPDILPDALTGLAIPMGFPGETTNAAGGFQPCAPADQNFLTFLAAADAAPWLAAWELEGADHMDFVFDQQGCGLVCSVCGPGTADAAAVQATVLTLTTAFLRRHLLDEPAMDAWLVGERLPDDVVLRRR